MLVIGIVRGNGTFGGSPSNGYVAMTTANSGSQFAYLPIASASGSTNTGYSGWTSTSWTSGIFGIKMNAITSTHIRHSVKGGL